MRARNTLQVVLDIRRHKEDVEERRLADILREQAKAQTELGRIAAELEQITAARLRQIEHLLNGLHHQETEATFRRLAQDRTDMLANIQVLEQQKNEQMSLYLAARCGREVIEEVHGKREALRRAEINAREQKRVEELFLTRRIPDSDTSAC